MIIIFFLDNNRTELYSYACRTGIGVSSTTGITDPKKNNSLAQHMANIGKITVFAYMRKTDYKNTWGTIAHRRTYESDHDSALMLNQVRPQILFLIHSINILQRNEKYKEKF